MRFCTWILGSLALFGLAIVVTNADGGDKKQHPHHHYHHALWELRDARKELQEAKHDFAGHKEKALAAINDAIKQIDLILKNHNDNIKGAPTRGDLKEVYKQYTHHPHLHHALHECLHAHKQLEEARHDFGHRKAALRDIHAAIVQIELVLKHHKKA